MSNLSNATNGTNGTEEPDFLPPDISLAGHFCLVALGLAAFCCACACLAWCAASIGVATGVLKLPRKYPQRQEEADQEELGARIQSGEISRQPGTWPRMSALDIARRTPTNGKVVGRMAGMDSTFKVMGFWLLVARVCLSVVFTVQTFQELKAWSHMTGLFQHRVSGLSYRFCMEVEGEATQECMRRIETLKAEYELASPEDTEKAMEMKWKYSKIIDLFSTFAFLLVAFGFTGISILKLRKEEPNEKDWDFLAKQLLGGVPLKRAAGMSSLKFLWMINVSSVTLWWKVKVSPTLMGFVGDPNSSASQAKVRVARGVMIAALGAFTLVTGLCALQVKLYDLKKLFASTGSWDVWMFLKMLSFLNNIVSVIDIEMVQRDRLDLFVFGGYDGKITRREDVEKWDYFSCLVKRVVEAFDEQRECEEEIGEDHPVPWKDLASRFAAFQLLVTFESGDFQAFVLDDRKGVVHKFFDDFYQNEAEAVVQRQERTVLFDTAGKPDLCKFEEMFFINYEDWCDTAAVLRIQDGELLQFAAWALECVHSSVVNNGDGKYQGWSGYLRHRGPRGGQAEKLLDDTADQARFLRRIRGKKMPICDVVHEECKNFAMYDDMEVDSEDSYDENSSLKGSA